MSNSRGIKRTATLNVEWKDLTKRHRLCRETIEANIEQFPDPVEATYAVGAIGAGKSLLLLHGFRYAWQDQAKPAIYLDLSDLIDELVQRAEADGHDVIHQSNLHGYFEDICIERLREVRNKIEQNEPFDTDDYLPRARQRPTPDEYFSELGSGGTLNRLRRKKTNSLFLSMRWKRDINGWMNTRRERRALSERSSTKLIKGLHEYT